MAFKLGDLVIDRIISAVAENSEGALLYVLTNLQDGTIDITADSVDATDGTGAIIKTFYRAKTGTFTATNSTLSLPVLEATSGSAAQYASAQAAIEMPMIINAAKVNASDATVVVDLPGISDNGSSNGIVVNAVNENGTLGDAYVATTDYVIATVSNRPSKMTITCHEGDSMFIIKYNRSVTENGVKIVNRSDKFPKSHKLTLKVLVVDPCETDVVRAAYVVFPNFQPSPEVSISLTTDGTLDYSGNLQTSYCGAAKILYEVYVCADDEEDAA